MIEGRYLYYGDDMKDMIHLRKKLSINDDNSKYDDFLDVEEGIYVIIYIKEEPKGMGKLKFDGSDFFIDEVMILPMPDKDIYLDFIIRMLVDKAILLNCNNVKSKVPITDSTIYRNIGFKIVDTKYDEYEQEWLLLELNPNNIQKTCSSTNND